MPCGEVWRSLWPVTATLGPRPRGDRQALEERDRPRARAAQRGPVTVWAVSGSDGEGRERRTREIALCRPSVGPRARWHLSAERLRPAHHPPPRKAVRLRASSPADGRRPDTDRYLRGQER